jgi:MYXO-CTERM domain-containing protein
MRSRFPAILRVIAAFLFTSALLAAAFPGLARAGGTVTVSDLQPKEDDGKWKLKMSMNYGGTPPTAHIPMLFTFTQTVLYERSLTDQSPKTPVLTKKPLSNQPPINESMDVGFSDPTGKVFTITKFDFVIRRDHGFEAGEYNLVIKRSNDGVQMGQTIHLTLQGDNEVVDRRAIVFTGEKKDKDKDKKDNAAASPDEKKDEPQSGGQGETSGAPGDGAEGTGGGTPVEAPPANPPKQGGCGCRVAEPAGNSGLFLTALAGLCLLAWRRRRH